MNTESSILAEIDALPDDAVQLSSDEKARESQTDIVVRFANGLFDFIHDENGEVYARQSATGEVRRINSRSFRDILQAKYYNDTAKAIRAQSMAEAVNTLQSIGRHSGEKEKISLRVGQDIRTSRTSSPTYYLDLGRDGDSCAVEWGADGWSLTTTATSLFVRGEAMQPLPVPVKGGGITRLWNICNVPAASRTLLITCLIDYLRPNTPNPVLELVGEAGSAKSTTHEACRRMIDPSSCNLRGAPKTVEDIFVAAGVNHIVAFENITHLPGPMQDALCILSTGGGLARRRLYTDNEESVINVCRPVIINGISASITQQDLVDRTISIECPVIQSRKTSSELWRAFDDDLPSILGGLLDIACAALKILPRVQIDPRELPRLAEFAMLGMAVASAMGQDPREFLEQFRESRRDSISRTIDASPVATAVVDYVEFRPDGITAPVKEILVALERYRPNGVDSWPRSAKGLGDALRRAAPALRQMDIECICLGKIGGAVKWSIQRKLDKRSPKSPEVLIKPADVTQPQDIRTCRTLDAQVIPSAVVCPRCGGEGCRSCGG